ncbi:MAG: CRISPR-associated helicase Cas3', partial [Candidatus Baldrarchaeia archaeon]
SPFFANKCVIVTLDTFMLNLFKAPAYELQKILRHNVAHFEFPRGNIYSSIIVFDEFHLFAPMATFEEELKTLGTVIQSIISLALAGVPIVIMSATIPKKLVQLVETELSKYGIKKEKITFDPSKDPFEKFRSKKKIRFEISSDNLSELITEHCHCQGKKTLVVVNEVKNAIKIYQALKDEHPKPLLLHGRLPEKVKKERSNKILETQLLIATQIVEAGIDASFDVLVSEICPPDRLIQRMGRVARTPGHDQGEVYVLDVLSKKGVYDNKIITETLSELHQISSRKYYSRSYIESKIHEIMNHKIYGKREIPKFDRSLSKALEILDTYLFLDWTQTVELLELFGGFTNSFNIITAFDSEDVLTGTYRDYAVGLSENMAKYALRKTRKIVREGKIESLNNKELKMLLSGISLSFNLVRDDIEGIIVEKIDKDVGYLGVDL